MLALGCLALKASPGGLAWVFLMGMPGAYQGMNQHTLPFTKEETEVGEAKPAPSACPYQAGNEAPNISPARRKPDGGQFPQETLQVALRAPGGDRSYNLPCPSPCNTREVSALPGAPVGPRSPPGWVRGILCLRPLRGSAQSERLFRWGLWLRPLLPTGIFRLQHPEELAREPHRRPHLPSLILLSACFLLASKLGDPGRARASDSGMMVGCPRRWR